MPLEPGHKLYACRAVLVVPVSLICEADSDEKAVRGAMGSMTRMELGSLRLAGPCRVKGFTMLELNEAQAAAMMKDGFQPVQQPAIRFPTEPKDENSKEG